MDKKKRVFLYTAGFIFGVALWAKLMFLGYFLGVLGAFLIFGKRSFVFLRTKVFKKKQDIAIFVLAFMLGCAPLIIFNILNRWSTVVTILNSFNCSFRINESLIWNNMNFLHNFKIRVGNFSDLLNSQIACDSTSFVRNNINPVLFYLSISVILLYLLLAKKETLPKLKISFLFIAYGILLCLSSFIPRDGSFDPSHVVILIPIVQITEALFISLVIIYLRKKIWAYLIIFLMFIPHAYKEFNIMRKIWDDLKEEENVIGASVVNNLTDYLASKNIKEVFCCDNNFLQAIDFISGLKIITWGFSVRVGDFMPHPFYLYHNLPKVRMVTAESVYEYQLNKLNPFYMVIRKDCDFSQNVFQRLKKLILRDKKQLILMKAFTNKMERVCYELYRVKENGNQDF